MPGKSCLQKTAAIEKLVTLRSCASKSHRLRKLQVSLLANRLCGAIAKEGE